MCCASSEHRGRRLLSDTVGRRCRRAPLSCTASNRSARVNYGDCRALLSPDTLVSEEFVSLARWRAAFLEWKWEGKTVKMPSHVCVQMAIRVVHAVILHDHPCRHHSQFQSLLFLFSIFPTHLGCPFNYYFFVPSYVCTIFYSISYSYIQYLYSQYSFR